MDPELISVTSADGSVIGLERTGHGPALVAVHGGTADRSRWAPVRDLLAESFTTHLVDRRGRGTSAREAGGPYALEREVEDVLAVLDWIGEPSYLLGHSYGAVIGMEVLAATDRIRRAFLYEPPFDADGHEVVPETFRRRYAALIDSGRPEEALDLFYRDVIGVDPTPLHDLPIWQARAAAAHTLVREGEVAATYVPDPARFAGASTPVLVLTGTASPPAFGAAAKRAAAALPYADLVEAPGFGHTMIDADPQAFVRLVTDFLLRA